MEGPTNHQLSLTEKLNGQECALLEKLQMYNQLDTIKEI